MCTPKLGAFEDLPTEEEQEENRDVDVRDEEFGGVPMAGEEYLKAVDEDEQRCPKQAPDGKARLKHAVVYELRAVDALDTVASPCTKRD